MNTTIFRVSFARAGLLVVMLGCALAVAVSGCGNRESKGATALQFTNWTIVFEAIPARAANIGATGVLVFGSGSSSGGNIERGIQFRQFVGKDATIVSLNNYTFKLMKGGRQISFNDHFY